MNFKSFFERKMGEQRTFLRATALYINNRAWNEIMDFPPLFKHKLNFVNALSVKKDDFDVCKDFFSRLISLCASFLGYRTSGYFNFPKTKVYLAFHGSENYATHFHNRKTSWSHTLVINVDTIGKSDVHLEALVSTIVHELAHELQVTTRRLRYSDEAMSWRGDDNKYIDYDDNESEDAYNNAPWEIDARKKEQLYTNDILRYIETGIAAGNFNPKQV